MTSIHDISYCNDTPIIQVHTKHMLEDANYMAYCKLVEGDVDVFDQLEFIDEYIENGNTDKLVQAVIAFARDNTFANVPSSVCINILSKHCEEYKACMAALGGDLDEDNWSFMFRLWDTNGKFTLGDFIGLGEVVTVKDLAGRLNMGSDTLISILKYYDCYVDTKDDAIEMYYGELTPRGKRILANSSIVAGITLIIIVGMYLVSTIKGV